MPLKAVGKAAAALIGPEMLVGLGTGTTAEAFVKALAERVRTEGLRLSWTPTSERTATLARRLGLGDAVSIEAVEAMDPAAGGKPLDIVVDGADAIERGTLNLIKGYGGAARLEKRVARLTKRFVVIGVVDKLVDRLGEGLNRHVPVDVRAERRAYAEERIQALGGRTVLRTVAGDLARAFVTDAGDWVLDCEFPDGVRDWAALDAALGAIDGVTATGLFLGMADEAILGVTRKEVVAFKRTTAATATD